MFGFLAPAVRLPTWRRSYARVCQYQRRHFGLTSLPFLSYEAAFLYQVAVDLGVVSPLPEEAPQCCRLRRLKHTDPQQDAPVAEYAAAFGVMLLGVKLQDDVVDSGRMIARLVEWKYRRQVLKAQRLLTSAVMKDVQAAVTQHADLEACQERDLETFATPTSNGFAAAFSGLPHVATDVRRQLGEIGSRVGRALIAWDCAVDFRRDQIKGDYNPLTSQQDVRAAFDNCLLQLAHIGWQMPTGCTTSHVIASVMDRVRAARKQTGCDPVQRLERWGLLRQKGRAYARCDCLDACCVVGECGECCGGAAEAGGLCADCGCAAGEAGGAGLGSGCCGPPGGVCCADCCFFGDPCGDTSTTKKKTKSDDENSEKEPLDVASPYAWCHGKSGATDGPLNPAGYVTVDGERVPAKTADGRFFDSGQNVRVVRTDPFGVTVEAE